MKFRNHLVMEFSELAPNVCQSSIIIFDKKWKLAASVYKAIQEIAGIIYGNIMAISDKLAYYLALNWLVSDFDKELPEIRFVKGNVR